MTNKNANTNYSIVKEINERWSPRAFAQKEISEEVLMSMFEAARWAASSNNYQPWRFMWARKGTKVWDQIFDLLSEFNQSWVSNATILVLTAYKEKFDNGKLNFHALHDLGLAVGNLSIQAQSHDIGVHQMAGVNWKKAHEVFEIPEGFHVTTAIAMGYHGGDSSVLPEDLEKSELGKRSRKPLNEIVSENNFNL